MTKEEQRLVLGDVCEIDRTQGVHRNLPYVGLEDIESNTALFIGTKVPRSVKSSTFRFSVAHVLYGRLRPYLNKILTPDFEGHCSTEIFPLKPSAKLSRDYLRYWLLSNEVVNRINSTCTGARMPRANMDAVLAFDFPLVPLEKQRHIVVILDKAFESIAIARANAEKNLQNTRELFESQREQILERRGEDWREVAISDLCHIKHGFAFKSEFFADAGDYVLLTPGNFYESGGYRDRGEKQKYYVGPVPEGYVLREGDLLVAMTEQAAGLLGSPILIPASGRFLHNQRLGLIVRKPRAQVKNSFLFHVFNTKRVRAEIHKSASGVKVRHTSPDKIGQVVIAVPSTFSEQETLAAHLEVLENEVQRLEFIYRRKLAALDELKQSLLHQAFSGQL